MTSLLHAAPATSGGRIGRSFMALLKKYRLKFLAPREEYLGFKRLEKVSRSNRRFASKASGARPRIQTLCAQGLSAPRSFRHSGNAGDLIYALPALRLLARGAPAKLLLRLDVPAVYYEGIHPLGSVRMNRTMAERLLPLLRAQPYLDEVNIDHESAVDCDLDEHRDIPIAMSTGHIPRWYFNAYGLAGDLSEPWIYCPPREQASGIVVARSQRYRNVDLDLRLLNDFADIRFVGTQEEFNDFRRLVPKAEYAPCSDFLQLAQVIRAARFFIGNQSFPYALAEAMKVPRVLEVCPWSPNVVPHGKDAYEAQFQPVFEAVIQKLSQQFPS